MPSAKYFKCASIGCYFIAAASAVTLGASVKTYLGDIALESEQNSQAYTVEQAMDRLNISKTDTQFVMPIAGAGLAFLTGVFLTLGRRNREDANSQPTVASSPKLNP